MAVFCPFSCSRNLCFLENIFRKVLMRTHFLFKKYFSISKKIFKSVKLGFRLLAALGQISIITLSSRSSASQRSTLVVCIDLPVASLFSQPGRDAPATSTSSMSHQVELQKVRGRNENQWVITHKKKKPRIQMCDGACQYTSIHMFFGEKIYRQP